MSETAYTADGTAVPMRVGDTLTDEFGTTAIEYLGCGEWRAKIAPTGSRFVTVGEVFTKPQQAQDYAVARWFEEYTLAEAATL